MTKKKEEDKYHSGKEAFERFRGIAKAIASVPKEKIDRRAKADLAKKRQAAR